MPEAVPRNPAAWESRGARSAPPRPPGSSKVRYARTRRLETAAWPLSVVITLLQEAARVSDGDGEAMTGLASTLRIAEWKPGAIGATTPPEALMNRRLVSRLSPVAVLALALLALACGGSSLEGTYRNANGLATLELGSGGSAAFALMGENHTCTYKEKSGELVLTCPNQDVLKFTMHDDGSITPGETFIGTMTKSKG